mgnify:CR=1 FL=1
MIAITKLTPLEQVEKARKRYSWRVDRAHYHNDIIDACLEYMKTLEAIINKIAGG